MQAVIKTGGKQYTVSEGQMIDVDKIVADASSEISFDKVLCVMGSEVKVGKPFVEGASVQAQVIAQFKDKKVIIFKSRRRKDSKLKKGFRKQLTKVKITKISA